MTMIPSDQEILAQVRKSIAKVRRIPIETVQANSLFVNDLGVDSMDFLDILFGLETHFGIEFIAVNVFDKLSELLAPKKLEENGILTSVGAEVLRRRLPEIDPDRLEEGKPALGIEAHFTPRTFVRAVKELLNARPQACPDCQSDRLEVARPSVLECKGCQAEIRCPTAPEVVEIWARNLMSSTPEA